MTKLENQILKEIKINRWKVENISYNFTKQIIQFDILKQEQVLNERMTLEGWRDKDFLDELKNYCK